MRRKIIDDQKLLEMIKAGVSQKECAKFFGVTPVSICQRLKRLLPPPDLSHLTEKQRGFVKEVAKGNSPSQSALKVYDCKDYASAKSFASELMRTPEISEGIAELMEHYGLTRGHRIKRLKSHVDHADPNISLKALDMSFKLDNSYPPARNINANINVNISPVDLSKYRTEPEKGN